MKQKLFFTVQVFTVLALFLSVFVTSLLREKDRSGKNQESAIIIESHEEDGGTSSSLFTPFTHVLPQLFNF